jgi:uncharacterized protein YdeI (YjbR/CyaY-like superfamily)
MDHKEVATGVVHKIPTDLLDTLYSDGSLLERWNNLTPLARNEWICWVISTKKQETRSNHINRLATEVLAGKRRPCCWIGCIHRTDKEISPSVRGILKI